MVVAADVAAARKPGDQRLHRVAPGRRKRLAARGDPFADGGSFELARAFGARQFRGRPDRRAANPLMILQPSVRVPQDGVPIDAGFEHQHRVHPFLALARHADDC